MDFGDKPFTDDRFRFSKPILWRLFPVSSEGHVALVPIRRDVFIEAAVNGSSINGIHDPKMTVMRETEISLEAEPQNYDRRESESYLDYSLRVWGID